MTVQFFAFMPVEVFADPRLTLTQLRVLGAISSFRSKGTNIVFPRRDVVSKRCGVSVTKISTATTALEKYGWLKKTGKGGFGRPVQYEVCFSETIPLSRAVPENGTTAVTESGTRTNGEQTNEQTNTYRGRAGSSRLLPDDLTPSEKHRDLARELGVDLNREFPKFRAHHQSKGSKFKDWNAALDNWLRRAAEYATNRAVGNRCKPTSADFSGIDYGKGVREL